MIETIRTPRLILRPLRESDLESLAATVNNYRIARNLLRVPWPYSLDDARAFYQQLSTLRPPSAQYALLLADAGTHPIGMIGYENTSLGLELGYWLAESWWGKGLMSEAASSAVCDAFERARVERLTSRCFLHNEASRRLLVALGFRFTGTSRMFAKVRRCHIVSQDFELTAKEWALLRNKVRRSKRRPA